MGLDMYLQRMPRYGKTTAREVCAIESYLEWKRAKEDPNSKAKQYTLKQWCGVEYKDVPKGAALQYYKNHGKFGYAAWDTEQKYSGRFRIIEEVGYWRKANQIHNWFVDHVQNGIDDCGYHNEVTKEMLEKLLATCMLVLNSCEMADGEINNGYEFKDGTRVPITTEGKYIVNPAVAAELLPTASGFFFGSTDYDEYYVADIQNTIDIINTVLETTDFDTQMIYYASSW